MLTIKVKNLLIVIINICQKYIFKWKLNKWFFLFFSKFQPNILKYDIINIRILIIVINEIPSLQHTRLVLSAKQSTNFCFSF